MQTERDQRSQVPRFHNPKTIAGPTARCFESCNPSTDLAVRHQKTGPPFDGVKAGHLQRAQRPLTAGLFLIDVHGSCEIKSEIIALATLFTVFFLRKYKRAVILTYVIGSFIYSLQNLNLCKCK